MENIIKAAVERGASDLHVKAGDVFRARINGVLEPLTKQRLTPEQTKAIALSLISLEEDRKRIDSIRDYDCSWGAPGIGRFRVNILRQRSSYMIVMRVIPFEVPTLEKLALPRIIEHIAAAESGLVLVTGGASSGKSSTMAAMINHVNTTMHKHIVTVENPIEFLHRDIKSSVTQREVGSDTSSFESGMNAAVRQDCDVVMVAELPDTQTTETALKVVEAEQLLISSFPSYDVPSSIAHLIAMLPPDARDIGRVRLAESLHAIVSQRLLPRADERGRCVVAEIMVCTDALRELIRAGDRMGEIKQVIAAGRDEFGMQTFDQHLMDLVEVEVVGFDTALAAAQDRAHFARAFPNMQTGSSPAEDSQ